MNNMESILNKIILRLKEREKNNFKNFSYENNNIKIHRNPINILKLLEKEFFYIFEIKKASPSKGIICEDFDILKIYESYKKAGASAISIITEPDFFLGDIRYFIKIRERTQLPLLRKDFIIHPYQVYESFNIGADFILLIVRCLDKILLKELYDLTLSLGMGVLLEIHDEKDLELAMSVSPKIIGINNRNLTNFQVDITNSIRLIKEIPNNIYVISESGITNSDEVKLLKDSGFSGVLIGESILKSKDTLNKSIGLINGKN